MLTDSEFRQLFAESLARARKLKAKEETMNHDPDENYRCRRCGETARSIVMKNLPCHDAEPTAPQGGDLLLRVQLVRPGQKIPVYSVDIDPNGHNEINLGYPGLPVGNRTLYGLRVLLNLSAAIQDDTQAAPQRPAHYHRERIIGVDDYHRGSSRAGKTLPTERDEKEPVRIFGYQTNRNNTYKDCTAQATSAPNTPTGEPDAPDPVSVEGSDQREHKEGDACRPAAEASDRDKRERGPQEQRRPRYWLGEE